MTYQICKTIVRIVGLFTVVSLFSGCASSGIEPLDQSSKDRITASRARVIVAQEELNAEIEGAVRSGDGVIPLLIGLAIESKRTDRAMKTIEPIRNQLINFDIRGEFDRKIRESLLDVKWLKAGEIEMTGQSITADDLKKLRDEIKEDTLVVAYMNYALSPHFRQLKMYLVIQVWQRGMDDKVFLGKYRYISAPVGKESGEKAAAKWASNNGFRIQAVLREGMNEIARIAKMDLNSQNQPAAPLNLSDSDAKIQVGFDGVFRGFYRSRPQININVAKLGDVASEIIDKQKDRIVYRDKDGIIFSGFIFSSGMPDVYRPPTESVTGQK